MILLAGLLPANATADLVNEENAADYVKVNTLGTVNVLEYCRTNGIKKIISATTYGDVSGAWKKNHAITEDEPRISPLLVIMPFIPSRRMLPMI